MFHKVGGFCMFCFLLYPWCLEQCLAHSRHWMEKSNILHLLEWATLGQFGHRGMKRDWLGRRSHSLSWYVFTHVASGSQLMIRRKSVLRIKPIAKMTAERTRCENLCWSLNHLINQEAFPTFGFCLGQFQLNFLLLAVKESYLLP
jgi:hypothetical protein